MLDMDMLYLFLALQIVMDVLEKKQGVIEKLLLLTAW